MLSDRKVEKKSNFHLSLEYIELKYSVRKIWLEINVRNYGLKGWLIYHSMLSKHTWLLFLYFLWKLLRWLKLFSLSLSQRSGKPFCCYEFSNQFKQRRLNKSTLISHCVLRNRFHVVVHLFGYRSHVMSEYGKNKKVAHKMQLCSFQAFSDWNGTK